MIGERLKSARKMAGLSLEQLARKMGNITRQGISNYERGIRKPDSKTLIMLSKALGVRPEYFFSLPEIELGDFEYRKRARLPKKEKERIEEMARDIISRYLEIENLLGEQPEWENPLKDIRIKSMSDVEKAAITLRNRWELGKDAIPNLTETLENNGIKVIYLEFNEKFDGLANFVNNVPIIILNKKMKDTVRKRFTLAHELGHLLLNFENRKEEKERERYCHIFAGALLIPKEILFRKLGGKYRSKLTLAELISVKEEYGMSFQAIMKRMHLLRMINDSQYKRFNIIVRQNNWRINEPGEYKIEEKPERFKNLVYRAVAEGIITIGKAASLLNITITKLRNDIELVT